MKHLSLAQIVDYVRGLNDNADPVSPALHLASGCRPCTQMTRVLRRVWEVGQLPHQDPPREVVDRAIAIYAARTTARFLRNPPGRLRLVPAMAGIRALPAIVETGHAAFETKTAVVEVRVDQEPDGLLTLSGQLSSRTPGRAVDAVPVVVSAGGITLTRTMTNAFGEFQLQFPRLDDLRLWLQFADSERIDCVLERLTRLRRAPATARRSK